MSSWVAAASAVLSARGANGCRRVTTWSASADAAAAAAGAVRCRRHSMLPVRAFRAATTPCQRRRRTTPTANKQFTSKQKKNNINGTRTRRRRLDSKRQRGHFRCLKSRTQVRQLSLLLWCFGCRLKALNLVGGDVEALGFERREKRHPDMVPPPVELAYLNTQKHHKPRRFTHASKQNPVRPPPPAPHHELT